MPLKDEDLDEAPKLTLTNYLLSCLVWSIFFMASIPFSTIIHESGHALACDLLGVKIDHVYLHPLLLEGKVSHIPTGILQKESIISYMGGGFAYLVFSTMLIIFYKDGDRRYLSVYLTFMISHLITAFFESARHSWYLNNAGPVSMWGTIVGLLVSAIVYFRQDLKTILNSRSI